MKISLDAGALCERSNRHFGNYTFTQSLIDSIQKYDSQNEYYAYSFCKKPIWLKETDKFRYKILTPSTLWLSARISIEEVLKKKEIFLALNQAIPVFAASRVISFSHGLSFYYYPQFYPESYYGLKDQLGPMVNKSACIVVPSRRVKNEMEKIFPDFKRFKIINYGVPVDMLSYKKRQKKKYFLFTGMDNRIKNLDFIIKAFKYFKQNRKFSDYKLFLVGNLERYEDEKSGVFSFLNADRSEIRTLYSQATAYLTASYYESFNFPVLEALSQNCPVIGLESAIIPEFSALVNTAVDSRDFVSCMISCAENSAPAKSRETVLKRFSWQTYIRKLKELY